MNLKAQRLKSGLVSVSFRKLGVEAVLDLAQRAALDGVEWGGDVHVPHGDLAAARRAAQETFDAGLSVAAYGSYYRLGGGPENPAFEDVLRSAKALGAPLIRVWAGHQGSAALDESERTALTRDAARVAALAWTEGIRLGLEYHAHTLTDTPESTLRLLLEAGHPALNSFWQPPVGLDKRACLDGLRALVQAGRLESLHVFHWWPDAATRLPLADGEGPWADYLKLASQAEKERYCCLEFVRADDPEQCLRDAATLKAWLAALD